MVATAHVGARHEGLRARSTRLPVVADTPRIPSVGQSAERAAMVMVQMFRETIVSVASQKLTDGLWGK